MALTFSKEYWLVSFKYHPKMTRKEQSVIRADERAKLVAAGFKTEYRYPLKSEGLAKAMIKRIKDATGVEMSCDKAFHMGF